MFKLAVFVSGGGTNLQAILDQIASGFLKDIEIACVIASKPDTYAEVRAVQAGIPCHIIRRSDYDVLPAYDTALIGTLQSYGVDLIVLAGFLSLLGPGFIHEYQNRIINIHPSLIPAFCGPGLYGIKPHQAALDYGVKVTGATVHFVDEQYDEGPILLQKCVVIEPGDTAESLQQRVMKEAEQVILPQAIAFIAAGKVSLTGRISKINQ